MSMVNEMEVMKDYRESGNLKKWKISSGVEKVSRIRFLLLALTRVVLCLFVRDLRDYLMFWYQKAYFVNCSFGIFFLYYNIELFCVASD